VNRRFRAGRDGLLAGSAVLACALLFAWQAWLLPSGPAWSTVGPALAPRIVTALLAVLGAALIAQALLCGQPVPSREPVDRIAFAWLFAGIALEVALIGRAGFVLASTVLFVCTARAFGSRRLLRDAAIGFALAAIAHVAFDRVLGYHIGGGLVERFL
jgi:putative tricarboxylic transport membrane protein